MKIVKLKGGLGNQMFQYAFGKAISKRTNKKLILDKNIYDKFKDRTLGLEEFQIKCLFYRKEKFNFFTFGTFLYKVSTVLKSIFIKGYYLEKTREYIDLKELEDYKYYDGYWQAEEYFKCIRKDLLLDFTLRKPIELDVSAGDEPVAIGFRRGDYFTNSKNKKLFDNCSEEYYKSAIKYITSKIKNPVFYVFSDDLMWVKNNINFLKGYKVFLVNEDKKYNPSEELILMSKCNHAIIPNSTFSWWGAWLIENDNKIVVAPKSWYANGLKNDIIPKEWIQIDKRGDFK